MPKLLTTPFASAAATEYRTDIQRSIGEDSNSATYEYGFPPETMRKVSEGGLPPKGPDFNGVLYDITDNIVNLTKGIQYGFNAVYAAAIGGYPEGAILRLNNGVEVISTVENNTIDPNLDMTGWVSNTVQKGATIPTYNTPVAGVDPVTGVGSGAYYNVRSGDDDTVAIEYQNVGGVPTSTGNSYPSGSYVETIAEYTALPFKQGKSYALYERVQLDNGDIVRNTVANNTINPNIDMASWEKVIKSTNALNLKDFPKKNGEAHDTPRINRMINKASELGICYCDIDDGDYYIITGISDTSWYGLDSGIYLKSGVYVRASKGVKIRAIPNGFQGYTILRSRSEYDIGWFGGEFIGDRADHTGSTGEWGHGLAIYGCERVFIDTKVSNCWGDGCLITSTYVNGGTQSKDVFLRLKADSNRRQGLSVTSVNGLYLLDGTQLNNTNGINPQCGFDFEPNASQTVENVFVGDISCSGNVGGGGLIYASAAGSKVSNVNFNILNCSNNQNNGFTVRHVNVDGVTVNKLITSGNTADGFRADNNPKSITIKEHISTNDNRPASINICRDFNAYKLNWKNPVSSEGSFTSVIGGLVENIICDYVDKNYALSLYSCSGNFKIGTVTTKGSLKDAIYLYGTNDCDIGFDVSGSKSVSAITLNASSRNIIRGVTRDQSLEVTTASAINLTNASLNNNVEHNIIKPTSGEKWLYGVYIGTNSTGNKVMYNDVDPAAYSSSSIMDVSGLNTVEFNSGQFAPDIRSVTTAQLQSVTYIANTKYKVAGRQVFNTTVGKLYYALGSTAVDKWRPVGADDGTQDITPT